jgi:hypothetical protein
MSDTHRGTIHRNRPASHVIHWQLTGNSKETASEKAGRKEKWKKKRK